MSVAQKEDKRKGLIATILFHIILILVLLFATFSTTIPPFPDEEIVMEMDFAGSESSGGAPQEVSESNNESSANTEDVVTQEEDSPVEVNEGKTNTSESNSNTNNETSETETQNPKNDFSNVFGNGNDGSGSGNQDGDGKDGQGDGISGPGTSGSVGAMSGRDLLSKPKVDNPIQQEGDVRVKIWIDRSGTVIQVKVLTTDPKTTSTSQAHFDAAAKAAKKFKFAPSSGGKDKEYGYVIIEFRNQ